MAIIVFCELPVSVMANRKILIMITSSDPDDAIGSGTRYEYTFPYRKDEENDSLFPIEGFDQSCAFELQTNGNLIVEAYHPIFETWDLAWESDSGEKIEGDPPNPYYLHLQLSGGNLVIYEGTETQPMGKGIWSSRTADEGVDKLYMYSDCTLNLEGEKNNILWKTTRKTRSPTSNPSFTPSVKPSLIPSAFPSVEASLLPTLVPSQVPSSLPSGLPSSTPTVISSGLPSNTPTVISSVAPSLFPSMSLQPSMNASISLSPTFFSTSKNFSSSSFKASGTDLKRNTSDIETMSPTLSSTVVVANLSSMVSNQNSSSDFVIFSDAPSFSPTTEMINASSEVETVFFDFENFTDDSMTEMNETFFNDVSTGDREEGHEDIPVNKSSTDSNFSPTESLETLNKVDSKVLDTSMKENTEEIQFHFVRTEERDIDIGFGIPNIGNNDLRLDPNSNPLASSENLENSQLRTPEKTSSENPMDFFFDETIDHSTDVIITTSVALYDSALEAEEVSLKNEDQAGTDDFDTEQAFSSEMIHLDWKEMQSKQNSEHSEEESEIILFPLARNAGKSNEVTGPDLE